MAIILTLSFGIGVLYSQGISELRDQKKKAKQDLELTTRLLEGAKSISKEQYSKLGLLESKIKTREDLIDNINSEISFIDSAINDYEYVVTEIIKDLDIYQEEYAETIRSLSYKNKDLTLLSFILSSESFYQAFKRMLYYQQYMDYRREQKDVLIALRSTLERHVSAIQEKRALKDSLLNDRAGESQLLQMEMNEQQKYYGKLQQEQKHLLYKLTEAKKRDQELQDAIQAYIESQINNNSYEDSPESSLISENFEDNKGRLPWPLDKGIIIEHFGIHEHSVLKNIEVMSSGVTFATEQEAGVRAVFAGLVSKVFAMNNGSISIIIRHGKYLSVYSNLQRSLVNSGDNVGSFQQIGILRHSRDGNEYSELKFQIWKEKNKLNPEDWLLE
ncbi:MAG: murein hydrolase activator EnvC family protein [Bacteroidales bacterium]